MTEKRPFLHHRHATAPRDATASWTVSYMRLILRTLNLRTLNTNSSPHLFSLPHYSRISLSSNNKYVNTSSSPLGLLQSRKRPPDPTRHLICCIQVPTAHPDHWNIHLPPALSPLLPLPTSPTPYSHLASVTSDLPHTDTAYSIRSTQSICEADLAHPNSSPHLSSRLYHSSYWRLVVAGEGSDEAAAAALIDAAVPPPSASLSSPAGTEDDSLKIAAEPDVALTVDNAPPHPPPTSRIGSSAERPSP